MTLIHEHVFQWARTAPTRVALTCHGRQTSYAELAEAVDLLASRLLHRGIRHGDRVAVCSRPSPAALTAYLAVASIGAVFQGINPDYRRPELEHVLGDAAPRLLLDSENGVAAETAALGGVAVERLGGGLNERPDRSDDLARARSQVVSRDAAMLVYTSGSTGSAKGALLPHGALALAAEVHARRWRDHLAVSLCPFPISHVASFSDIVGTSLVAGGRTVFLEKFDADAAVGLLVSERVTCWGFVPAAASMMVASPAWTGADLSHVEIAVWGGGPAPETLLRALRVKGIRASGCYGLTETVGNVCFTATVVADDRSVAGSPIGSPDVAYQTRLDPDTGELQVFSPEPFLGYLNQPDATREAFTDDGWLRTGDIATLASDGSLVLVGRTKEMYKSGGYNVFPREIELALETLDQVRLAAVISVPDELFGEVGHAYVVAPGATPERILGALRGLLAAYKLPKSVTLLDELPLLPVGKIDKNRLRSEASRHSAGSRSALAR